MAAVLSERPLRVLVGHNRYRSGQPSGENRLVDDEVELLRAQGVHVATMLPGSDDIRGLGAAGRVGVALGPLYNPRGVREFRALLAAERPDVVHLHNVFPLLSPWVVRTAHSAGVPVVQTVHNYRHGCVKADLYRDGRLCTDCVGRRVGWPGVVHACYRGSRPQSVAMVTGQALHRPTWRRVGRFLALTPFMAGELAAIGLPRDRIEVRPTSAPDPGPPSPPGRDVLFAGRLVETKGLAPLLEAWVSRPDHGRRLRIAGDGPLRPVVEEVAAGRDDIDPLGPLAPADLAAEMAEAAAVVVPSSWYEGLPRVIVEAYARGRPVIAPRLGSLDSVVDDAVGYPYEPGVPGLAAALAALADGPGLRARGEAARTRYLAAYHPDVTLRQLLDCYRSLTGPGR